MPHRILEPLILAPMAGVFVASAAPYSGWQEMLVGQAPALAVSLLVLWFLKGYYDKALTRESETRNDIREILERVIELAAKQHELGERATEVIEENSSLTRETNSLLRGVDKTLRVCHERHTPPSGS